MKTKYIWLITFLALASILFLQGMWVHNTYKLYEAELKKQISERFNLSVQKETIWQFTNPDTIALLKAFPGEDRKININIVFSENITNDSLEKTFDQGLLNAIKNNRIMQDTMYVYINKGFMPPFSLNKLDSIFTEESMKDFHHKERLAWMKKFKSASSAINSMFSYTITDSLGKQIDFFSHNPKGEPLLTYNETVKLRNIDPEYITLHISYGYFIGVNLGKMFLLTIVSVIVVLFVAYSLIRQIKIINRQEILAKQREDFTHSMIHDLKSPVTSIVSGISALKSGKLDDKPEKKEQFYSIITQESERIRRLVNKVLEVANVEDGSAVVSKTPVNLPDLLNSLTDKYKTDSEKPVFFHINLNGVETIEADQHYIYEAFDNLIENAIKYSKENEDADITITGIQKKNETQISFKDLGIGVSKKDQKKIFQKFERSMAVINRREKISGFGLGLNFVSQVIKAHGGTIKVNSRLGSYSEFIINLPDKDGNNKTVTD